MDFENRRIDFREADRRYADLKCRLDAGSISVKEFDAQRLRLMVRDDEGRWWAKDRKEGEWCYHAQSGWIRSTPPGYQPPYRTSPADDTREHHRPQPGQNEQSTLSFSGSQAQDERSPTSQNIADRRAPALQAAPPAGSSSRERGGERRLRGRSGNRAGISIGLGFLGVLLAIGLLAGIALASVMGVIGGRQEVGSGMGASGGQAAGTGMGAPSLPDTQSEPEAESQPEAEKSQADIGPPVAIPAPIKEGKSPSGGDNKPDLPTETRQSPTPSPSKPDTTPPVATPAPTTGGGDTGTTGGGTGDTGTTDGDTGTTDGGPPPVVAPPASPPPTTTPPTTTPPPTTPPTTTPPTTTPPTTTPPTTTPPPEPVSSPPPETS